MITSSITTTWWSPTRRDRYRGPDSRADNLTSEGRDLFVNLCWFLANTAPEELLFPANAYDAEAEVPAWLREHLRPDPSKLNLSGTQVTDSELEDLKGLTNLVELGLSNTQVSDAGLEHLKGITSLESLDLKSTQVTDAGLKHLKGLTKLRMLGL